ncbi:hypothetical protein G6F32_014273 [Rhizopus arrhizus]|nr:hypothetical protein G6F32_014273 [Rhizopus arrhizus]
MQRNARLAGWPPAGKRPALAVVRAPRVVAAEPPQVAFRVGAGVAAAAIVLVGDVDHAACPGGLGAGVMRIGIGDDHARALGLAATDLIRHGGVLRPRTLVAGRTEHDHAVAEGQLRMEHGLAIGVDGLGVEAEGALQPVDGSQRVAVAQARNDGGAVARRAVLAHDTPPMAQGRVRRRPLPLRETPVTACTWPRPRCGEGGG